MDDFSRKLDLPLLRSKKSLRSEKSCCFPKKLSSTLLSAILYSFPGFCVIHTFTYVSISTSLHFTKFSNLLNRNKSDFKSYWNLPKIIPCYSGPCPWSAPHCGVASNLSAKVEGPLYIHKCKLDCLKHCGPRNTIKIPCLAGSHKIPPISAPNLDKPDRKA